MFSQCSGVMSGDGHPKEAGGRRPISQCTPRRNPHDSQCWNIEGSVFVFARTELGQTNAVVLLGICWKFLRLINA